MQPMGPDLDERWGQLLDGLLDEAARQELLSVAANELNRVVVQRGGDCRGLLDAIGSIVDQGPVTEQIWEDANRGFELALGANSARLINWLVVDSIYAPRLAAVRPLLEPAAVAFLTDLLVRFGDRLERASYLFVTRSEHDWRLINREISVDRSTGRITVRLRITKYNGEILVIEGRPDSILTLADAVLTAVNAVGDRTAFLQDLGSFMDTVEQTLSMFSADEQSTGDSEAETITSTVVGRAPMPRSSAPTPYR
jgi:hypothetical protein